jgi:hypothetical protein
MGLCNLYIMEVYNVYNLSVEFNYDIYALYFYMQHTWYFGIALNCNFLFKLSNYIMK